MQKSVISASILSADFAALGADVAEVLAAGADWVHVDVMDNHYVPNLTFGPLVVNALKKHGIKAPLDVHLMVQPVDALVTRFAEAGADLITFHPEASHHPHRTLQHIRQLGCQAGLALNPGTAINGLEYLLDDIDLILVMSVNPGFAAQRFIPSALNKIKALRQLIDHHGKPIRLAVDGGVNLDTLTAIASAGADTFIIGSALFSQKDYSSTLQALKAKMN